MMPPPPPPPPPPTTPPPPPNDGLDHHHAVEKIGEEKEASRGGLKQRHVPASKREAKLAKLSQYQARYRRLWWGRDLQVDALVDPRMMIDDGMKGFYGFNLSGVFIRDCLIIGYPVHTLNEKKTCFHEFAFHILTTRSPTMWDLASDVMTWAAAPASASSSTTSSTSSTAAAGGAAAAGAASSKSSKWLWDGLAVSQNFVGSPHVVRGSS